MSLSANSTLYLGDESASDSAGLLHAAYHAVRLPNVVSTAILPGAFVLSTLVLWRLWRFTVLPWLYPDPSKEFPYWIPGERPTRKSTWKSDRTTNHVTQ